MIKHRKIIFFLLVCILMLDCTVFGADENKNQEPVYKSVKTDELIVSVDENEELSLSSSYVLKKQVEEDTEYDYYILENTIYFNKSGNYVTISHSTNDASIKFENADYSMSRLISNENKFITFFSKLNNFSKIKETIIEERNNIWYISRAFYAVNRYFDSSYTFKMQTSFKVPQDGEVRIDIDLSGSFDETVFKNTKQEINYNLISKKK